ncbi:MAG: S-methyl-5-thioribose kinase [Spirochaetaceae bacterium]
MEYTQLTEDSVVDYLKSVPAAKEVLGDLDNLDIREIGDGNLNFVYFITNRSDPTQTAVLKQAVPFLRIVGKDWPLPKERMTFEIMALEKESELTPEHVPEIYHSSHDMSLVLMQNLKDYPVLRGQMNEGTYFPNLAEHVSTFLAKNLFYTSDWYLDHRTKKEMVKKFINIDLCKITEDFIFTHPFCKSDTNVYNERLTEEDINFIHEDDELKIHQAELKYKFMNNAEALLHGDLHTGSIMADEEKTFVIDPEFAFFGPAGFDVALFIGNMFLAYFAHAHRQTLLGNDPSEYRTWILDQIRETWNKFDAKFESYWKHHFEAEKDLFWDYPGGEKAHAEYRRRNIARIFDDSMGIAGSVMIRRILGLAKVSDIADIEDLDARAEVERMGLRMGKELIINHGKYTTIEAVADLATSISPAGQAVPASSAG